MEITLGLDFGTHQSKLCVRTMPGTDEAYEFVQFVRPDGTKQPLLPSVIQINQDDTVSVGFVDQSKAKAVARPEPELPVFPEKPVVVSVPKPQLKLPPKPKKEALDWKQQLALMSNVKVSIPELQQWELKCQKLREEWEQDCKVWEITNKKNQKALSDWNDQVNAMQSDYDKRHKEWAKHPCFKQSYRYFKLSAFAGYPWPDSNIVKSDILCVWYITYVLLLVKDMVRSRYSASFDEDVFVQMGVPSSIDSSSSKIQRTLGLKILTAARLLSSSFASIEDFSSMKYQELLELTAFPSHIETEAESCGVLVIPEAFAGLQSLTNKRRLSHGDMHLLVDIGGGTTDIAFFTITQDLTPDIHSVQSFHKGLNFVLETFQEQNPEYSIPEAQELFMLDRKPFETAIHSYHDNLKRKLSDMFNYITNVYNQSRAGTALTYSQLTNALKGRPIVYCGGGSMYKDMRILHEDFNDERVLDKTLLNIPHLLNTDIDDSLFPILATSYGLSIPLLEEIKITDAPELFRAVVSNFNKGLEKIHSFNEHKEHGLLDD